MLTGKLTYLAFICIVLISCNSDNTENAYVDEYPQIIPDYINICIPNNIAPLNFSFESKKIRAELNSDNGSLKIKGRNKIIIPQKKFKKLLHQNIGDTIWISLTAAEENQVKKYKPFFWVIEAEQIDPFLTYRLIEPGYEVWNKVTLAQRNVTNFSETFIADNNLTDNSCMNCHIPNKHNPSQSFFHIRGKNSMTVIADGENLLSIDTKMKGAYASMVYGSWHPSGKYIAFSTNAVLPSTHSIHNKRAFVYDTLSDIVLLNLQRREVVRCEDLMQENTLETFPEFSADGTKLYYCAATKVDLPEEYLNLHYSIYSIDFDTNTINFGNRIDTLFNGALRQKTASELKASPNGKYLAFNCFSYGTFALWHNDSKIYLYNLATKAIDSLPELNNNVNYANSYKSWSTNSHWLAFASKRDNGLYSKIYFSYIDDEGHAHKPFVLPQKDPNYYAYTLKSYNVPELLQKSVLFDAFDIEEIYHNASSEKLRYTE